ncbi:MULTISPECIES: caspase family protein [unclassified Pseudomonas]|jgi:Caspase domain.|uniref:caspase family protein n=1 Tax=unclassified Pseudomonas TaxID=196821 RepID=UPI0004B5F2C4|nr:MULTISPECIES: caspase family protein [unclassified Pseudomonas]SME97540.1 Caspase domain-containing protein [Pseudomonas sp. LAMO17WK12:I1]
MAEHDYAILVGISRYRDAGKFPMLEGPLNDVELIREWLISPLGGAVPSAQIFSLITPELAVSEEWSPNRESFAKRFNAIALDQTTGDFVRREGRLYLYFSGHGFSKLTDQTTRAALYSADNLGMFQSNIAGTLYAEAAKRARLFREVVLIMDCCRDTESNVDYSSPDLNLFEHANTEGVRVFSMYAAPKRGKAQERELSDSNGKIVGLMTNALLRALQEAPCDIVGRVPGKVLMQYIGMNWQTWYPEQAPPEPRIIPPDNEDIFFQSGQALAIQRFLLPAASLEKIPLRLTSISLNAAGILDGDAIVWQDANLSWRVKLDVSILGDGRREFCLALPIRDHELFSATSRCTFVPGEQDAVII